jgi:murein DD-endopeptidase MepM/ murein hydrolase activator NlpD
MRKADDETRRLSDNKSDIDALNAQIEAKKKKIAEIQKAIDAYKNKITETQLQTVSLKNQVNLLDNHIAQVNLDVEATENKLDTLGLQLQSLGLSIKEKNTIIERQKKILAELIRELRREDGKKIIEVMAAYRSVSHFYDSVSRVQTLEHDLGKTTKSIRLAKAELETKQQETIATKENYEETHTELQDKKNNLQQQITNKQNLISQTQASEQKYKTLISSLKTQYQQTENEQEAIEAQVRKKLTEQQKQKPEKFDTDSSGLSWPIGSHRVTAYFHDPLYPYRTVFEHNAIDIATAHGTTVRAAASGYIARAKRCTAASCYAYVMIVHSNGISTVYGHLSAISVNEDQFVTRGDVIGYSGATPGTVGAGPFTTGPHLHFEVRKNGIPVDPLNYLK